MPDHEESACADTRQEVVKNSRVHVTDEGFRVGFDSAWGRDSSYYWFDKVWPESVDQADCVSEALSVVA
jgi:hypothetical protein